jgi:4-amino-4-deoxy-L-arabinose transferase-like glycosyltransferase
VKRAIAAVNPRRLGRAELTVLAVLSIVLTVLIAASVSLGSWGIPHLDDWDYARSALLWHNTGTLQLSGWGEMTLVGQLALVQPLLALHDSLGTLDAFGVGATVVYVMASYGLARRVLGQRTALIVAATVAVSPILAILSTTFMTDVPAAAMGVSALYLGCRAIGERTFSRGFFAAAVVAAVVAACIRETQAAVLVAIASTAVLLTWRQTDGTRRFVVLTSSVALALFGGVFLWRHQQPGATSLHYVSGVTVVADGLRLLSVASLCLIPILALVPWPRIVRYAPKLAWAVVPVVLIVAVESSLTAAGGILPGNLLLPSGPGGDLVLAGVRPLLLPLPLWTALCYIAAAALVGLLIVFCGGFQILRKGGLRRSLLPESYPATLVIAALAGISLATLASFFSTGVFDRYTLPALPPLAICIALISEHVPQSRSGERAVRRSCVLLAGVAAAGLLTLGLDMAISDDAYDAARWHAGLLLSQNLNPNRIDAGFEWSGFHATLPLQPRPGTKDPVFYTARFGIQPCVFVTNTAGDGAKPVAQWTGATGGTHTLFVQRLAAPGC